MIAIASLVSWASRLAWTRRGRAGVPGIGSLLCALLAATLPALAQKPAAGADAIVVLDGSNSMNNKLAGDPALKHILMREALRGILPKLTPGTRVGLAAFGHRRSGDCSDAELIEPPTAEPARIMGPLEKFQPRGFSPVVLAMRTAAKALRPDQAGAAAGKSSIIVVLDDLASCRGEDPCKVAADLRKDNPALTIHVVGLALKKADAQVMSCVAQQTGGRLFDAQDARAATAGLEQALQLASADRSPAAIAMKPAQPAPGAAAPKAVTQAPRPRVEEQLAPGLNLRARLSEGQAPLEQSMHWRLRAEGADEAAAPIAEANQPRLDVVLPNGRYVVEVQAGLVTARQTVEISKPDPLLVVVPLDAGLLSLDAPLQKGGEPWRRALLTVFQAQTGKPLWMAHAGADDLVVPADTYRIVAEDGLARSEQTVTAAAGARREVELVLAAGRLVVDATLGGAEPLTDNVQFIVEEDDPDSPNGKREIVRTAAPRLELTMPAGSYQVTARRGAAETRERLSVKAGEDTSRSITLAVGRVRLAGRFATTAPTGVPITYVIDRLDSPPRQIIRGGEAEPVLDLSPGRYRVEARIGAQNAVVAREIEVRAGYEQRVELNPGAGGVRLKLAGRAGGVAGLGFGEVFWQIVDENGRRVWRTSQIEPLMVLSAGRYSVSAELKERTLERTFEIKAGESRTIEVGG